MAGRVAVIADNDLLATVVSVVLARAGYEIDDDAPVVLQVGCDVVRIVAGGGRGETLLRPICDRELVDAVARVTRSTDGADA